jgi:hypothetical protein
MIRDDHELHRTQEQVVRFENALLSLRQQTFEKDPLEDSASLPPPMPTGSRPFVRALTSISA